MVFAFQQILPTWAVATGVALSLETYLDPLICSGFLNADNLEVIDKRSDAGYTLTRMDSLTWNTGRGYRDLGPKTVDFPVESQVTVQWHEVHNVKTKTGDVGLALDANMVDRNYKTMSIDMEGIKYVTHRAAQSVSAIYDGHLDLSIKGIFADHLIRSNETSSTNLVGTTITFDNDVLHPAATIATDLTATPTYMGELGEKLYQELREIAKTLVQDRSGRVVYFLVNQSTFEAWKIALDSFDRMGRSTASYGDTSRDNVKYTGYQPYINMNDLRIVGLKDSYFPRDVGDTYYRCICTTTDGVKMAVVRQAFESSIGAMGMTVSGGMQYAQQNGMDFNTMMQAIRAANPSLPLINADESGRLSVNGKFNAGALNESTLLNCITMMMERIPLLGTNGGHYCLNGQMWSTMVRNNVRQLLEVRVPDTVIPTSFMDMKTAPPPASTTSRARRATSEAASA